MSIMANRSRVATWMLVTMVVIMTMLGAVDMVLAFDEDGVRGYIESSSKVDSKGNVVHSGNIEKIIKENPYKDTDPDNQAIDIMVGGVPKTVYLSNDAYKRIGDLSDRAENKRAVRERVGKMEYEFNVQADVETAGVALSGLRGLVTTLVGLLAYVIVLGMTLFTALDVCYITMPVFKNKADEMVQRGGSFTTRTDSRTGEAKHRWITDDAQFAIANATIENGKSPLTIYLTKRIWAYVMLAIVLFILLTGNIQLIVNVAITLISGIIEALEGLV